MFHFFVGHRNLMSSPDTNTGSMKNVAALKLAKTFLSLSTFKLLMNFTGLGTKVCCPLFGVVGVAQNGRSLVEGLYMIPNDLQIVEPQDHKL